MKHAFINQLVKQRVTLTVEQHELHLNDFKIYCEEMEFITEDEFTVGALEYITCQINYGIFH